MAQHTPGPYKAYWRDREVAPSWDIEDTNGKVLARIIGGFMVFQDTPEDNAEDAANAQLFAAAPALLEACMHVRDEEGDFDMGVVEAAIARAEGRDEKA
jgi:hypothetical protein